MIKLYHGSNQKIEVPDLKVLTYPDYCEEWALFVLNNRDRNAQHPTHDYDIVYGPIADDGITFQYYFGTERALKLLKRL